VNLLLDDLRALLGWRDHAGRHVPGLLDDLVVTATRQDRIPSTGTSRDLREERTLDHLFPGTAATTALPGRLDALTLRRDVLATVNQIRRATRTLGVARLHQHPHVEEFIRTVSGENGHRVRAERIVDRPDGAFRIPCDQCGHRVPIDVDRDFITCRCGSWGDTSWWIKQVAPVIPEPGTAITGRDATAWLLVRHGIEVSEATLRQWATRGHVDRQGRDEHGRTTYDAAQILTRARRTQRTQVAA
jgi:hypothetical protein